MALGSGVGNIASLAAFCLGGEPFLAVTFHERPASATASRSASPSARARSSADAGFEETAGGAYVVALADGPLAARLAGRDSEVAVTVDGAPEGIGPALSPIDTGSTARQGCGGGTLPPRHIAAGRALSMTCLGHEDAPGGQGRAAP